MKLIPDILNHWLPIFFSLLSIILSLFTLYTTKLKRAELRIETDERIFIADVMGVDFKMELNLIIYNEGAKIGVLSDLLLVIDGKHEFVPRSRHLAGGFDSLLVPGYKVKQKSISFGYPPYVSNFSQDPQFDCRTLLKGPHKYQLFARLDNRNDWEVVHERTFENGLSTKFQNLRKSGFFNRRD